jgi:hypothetical protein
MKAGCVPYWPCGGEVLTRCLDRDGRLATRALGAEEAAALLDRVYRSTAEGAALQAALTGAALWRRAAGVPVAAVIDQGKLV